MAERNFGLARKDKNGDEEIRDKQVGKIEIIVESRYLKSNFNDRSKTICSYLGSKQTNSFSTDKK